MLVGYKQLRELNACDVAVCWFLSKDETDLLKLYELAKEEDHLDWCNWYLIHNLNHTQNIKYAIFAAESVIHLYENQYPNDNRPKLAIQAAKNYLEEQTDENKDAAAYGADGAYAAAADAACDAADAACAAAHTAADAACAAAADAKKELQIKIIDYGLSLLQSAN